MLLSAAMIVRNEQSFLGDCLKSIESITDEIVIVDTGSTDNTVSIAERFKAKVSFLPWTGDFSAPRNRALDLCQGKWILYIDADERVDPVDPGLLRPFLESDENVAYTVRFFPAEGHSPYREYRVFRNDPRIRYQGVIHETMLPDLRAVAKSDGLGIGKIPLTFRHLGFNKADQSRKHHRNLPLLQRAVLDHPENSYLWWHMGTILMALGREEEAVQALHQGLDRIRQNPELLDHDSLIYGELIRYHHHQGQEVMPLIAEALERFPDQHFIRWLKAVVLISKRQFEDAAALLEDLIAVEPDSLDSMIAYDGRLFKDLSLERLGDCYFKLGRFRQSADCYRRCEALDPDNATYQVKRRFVEGRR